MTDYHTSGKLYAQPSFLEGMARVVDIGATLQEYNTALTEHEADMKALSHDWNTVGEDIRSSLTAYEKQYGAQK